MEARPVRRRPSQKSVSVRGVILELWRGRIQETLQVLPVLRTRTIHCIVSRCSISFELHFITAVVVFDVMLHRRSILCSHVQHICSILEYITLVERSEYAVVFFQS